MRRSETIILLLVAFTIFLSGCSTGLVFGRFFTPDSKYLVWGEIRFDCSSPVRRTECRTGKTVVLGEGLFVPTPDREYILLVDWCPRPKEKPVALVRLRDAKRWTLPPLPKASVERYELWHTYHGDLDVHSADDLCPSLSFSVFVQYPVNQMASKHTLKSGRWFIEELVPVGGEPVETTETFMGPRHQDFQALLGPCTCEGVGECPACQAAKRYGHCGDGYTQLSPDGRYMLFEHTSEWGSYAELQTAEGKRVTRLTTATGHLVNVFRRIAELIYYGGAK